MKLSERDLWSTIVNSEVTSDCYFHAVIEGDSYKIDVDILRSIIGATEVRNARTGGGQSNASKLLAVDSLIDSATADGDSVTMPLALLHRKQKIRNITGYTLDIFPNVGDNFVGLGANVPMPLADGNTIEFTCFEDGEWHI
jgi:hypothetical protein